MYVNETRKKKAVPVLITPVSRNYPWKDGQLGNAHGDYPQAVRDVAAELKVPLVDLTIRSAEYFTSKGKDFVSAKYFMNLDSGRYEAYPNGQKDNTHFQPAGAAEVARLVFNELKRINIRK